MCCVSVCADSGEPNSAVLIGDIVWRSDGDATSRNSGVIDGINVVDLKGNILDGITVTLLVLMDFLQLPCILLTEAVALLKAAEWRSQNESHVAISYDVRCGSSRSSLQPAIRDLLEAHTRDVERCGLLGVADVPVHMVIPTVRGYICGGSNRGSRGAGWRDSGGRHDVRVKSKWLSV